MYTFKECAFMKSSRLKLWNLILDPQSPKLETQSSKVLRIKSRDASDCQLTFDRYCKLIYLLIYISVQCKFILLQEPQTPLRLVCYFFCSYHTSTSLHLWSISKQMHSRMEPICLLNWGWLRRPIRVQNSRKWVIFDGFHSDHAEYTLVFHWNNVSA